MIIMGNALMIAWQIASLALPVPCPFASDGYSTFTRAEFVASLEMATHHEYPALHNHA